MAWMRYCASVSSALIGRRLIQFTKGRSRVLQASTKPDVRDLLDAELTLANYPVRDVQALSGVSLVELIASLVPITADPPELDAVVVALESSPKVHTATWTAAASN